MLKESSLANVLNLSLITSCSFCLQEFYYTLAQNSQTDFSVYSFKNFVLKWSAHRARIRCYTNKLYYYYNSVINGKGQHLESTAPQLCSLDLATFMLKDFYIFIGYIYWLSVFFLLLCSTTAEYYTCFEIHL